MSPTSAPLLIRFKHSQKAAVAVEFALLVPVMGVMLLGLLDYAIVAFHKMELESATRSGAQYAMLDSSDTSLISTTVKNSTNLDTDFLEVDIAEFCECIDGSSITCADTCATGSVRSFMRITATYTHNPIFIPVTMTLTGESIIRTQ
ncbi:TadE family protein [Magnetovibrio sp.]|uniref:TadE/TadG family type IV pilus assembly protein n=1 Tax=Magnetovibrio sp. TaxID=2024836 RepID=UPI002F94FF27